MRESIAVVCLRAAEILPCGFFFIYFWHSFSLEFAADQRWRRGLMERCA